MHFFTQDFRIDIYHFRFSCSILCEGKDKNTVWGACPGVASFLTQDQALQSRSAVLTPRESSSCTCRLFKKKQKSFPRCFSLIRMEKFLRLFGSGKSLLEGQRCFGLPIEASEIHGNTVPSSPHVQHGVPPPSQGLRRIY